MIRGQDIKYALYYKKAKTNKTNINESRIWIQDIYTTPVYKIS